MKESNQVRKLLIASAVVLVLAIPAITSAAPEEAAESQLSLVDALNAGQATGGKLITLEDFEGGSGREQVFIPGKRADQAASAAAIGQLSIEQKVEAARLQSIRRAVAVTTDFERQAELQDRSLEARAAEGVADRESRQEIAELSQEGQGHRLDKRLKADRIALDKKIEAQLKSAEPAFPQFPHNPGT